VQIRRCLSPVAIYQQHRKVRPKCQQGCKTWPRRSFRTKCRTVTRYTSSCNFIYSVSRAFVRRFSRNSQKLYSIMCTSPEPDFPPVQTADRKSPKPLLQYDCHCPDHAPRSHLVILWASSVPKCSQHRVKTAQNTGNVSVKPLRHWLAPRAGLQCRAQQCLPEAQPTATHKLLA
jgi:hypothetical protein